MLEEKTKNLIFNLVIYGEHTFKGGNGKPYSLVK